MLQLGAAGHVAEDVRLAEQGKSRAQPGRIRRVRGLDDLDHRPGQRRRLELRGGSPRPRCHFADLRRLDW